MEVGAPYVAPGSPPIHPLRLVSPHVTPHRRRTKGSTPECDTTKFNPPPHWVEDATFKHADPNEKRYEAPAYDIMAGVMAGKFTTDQTKNTFITFNYDTLLEQGLHALNVSYTYEIQKAKLNKTATAEPSGSPNAVKVLKPHGSLNWRVGKGKGNDLRVFSDYRSMTGNKMPLLIPPTWRKSFDGPLADVWSAAVNALKTATNVVVIGFSIPPTDLHFRYLLAAGLRDNISARRVLFVNPDHDDSLRKRIDDLFRVQHRAKFYDLAKAGALEFLTSEAGLRMIGRPLNGPLRLSAPSGWAPA